jgi:uroporphyrinogen-III synthase
MMASTSRSAPLSGTTVAVTRPRGDVDELADALRAGGARVVSVPVVEVVDPDDGGAALHAAARNLVRYRWVAFTSANAVRRLLALVPDVRALSGVHLASVGPATAAALAAHHLVPDLVAQRPSAAGLGEAFPVSTVPGATVLFPASAGAHPTLPAALRAKGWEVDVVVAYRTVPASPPSAAAVRELESASAVTFASPSAVDAYLSLRTEGGRPLPVPPVVACIGPVTADAARAAGLEVAVVAAHASAAALVAALADALAGGVGAGDPGAARR